MYYLWIKVNISVCAPLGNVDSQIKIEGKWRKSQKDSLQVWIRAARWISLWSGSKGGGKKQNWLQFLFRWENIVLSYKHAILPILLTSTPSPQVLTQSFLKLIFKIPVLPHLKPLFNFFFFDMDPIASTSANPIDDGPRQIAIKLSTKDTAYSIPSTKFLVPSNWRRFHLSELINKVLENSKDFFF